MLGGNLSSVRVLFTLFTSLLVVDSPFSVGLDFLPESEWISSPPPSLGPPNWSEDIQVSSVGASVFPDISVGPDGSLNFAWLGKFMIPLAIYYKKLDKWGSVVVDDKQLTNWTEQEPNHSSADIGAPRIAVDQNGNSHIIWRDARNIIQGDIFYTMLDPLGNTLIDDTVLTESDGKQPRQASIDVDQYGNVHLVWLSDIFVGAGIEYSKLDPSLDDMDGDSADRNQILVVNKKRLVTNRGSPDLAVDSNGNVFVVFIDYPENLYSAKRPAFFMLNNDGNILINRTLVSLETNLSDNPNLFVDSSNMIHVTWRGGRDALEGPIFYTKLDPYLDDLNGDKANVSVIKQLDDVNASTTTGNYHHFPIVLVKSDGNASVIWKENDELWRTEVLPDGSISVFREHLTTIQRLHAFGYPSFGDVDRYDRLFIVWDHSLYGSHQIFMKHTLEELPSDNEPPVADAGPDQTVNEGDTVQFDGRNSSGPAEKPNISVEGNVVVNLPGYVHDWISGVAVDQDGVLYTAWHAGELKFAKSSDGKSFESHRDVAPAASNMQMPFIHADSNGTVYIVYGCPAKDGNDICLVRSNDGGKTFGNAIEVNDDWGISVQANPSMFVDTHGSIYVVWYDTRNGLWDVYFSKSTDGGSSFSPNVRVNGDSRDFPRAYPPSPALSIDDNGTIYVAWMDNRNMDFDIYFSKSSDNGTSFEPDLRVNDDLGDADQCWPSMVVDRKGLIHLVWEDERDGFRALYHAQSVDGGKNFSTNRKLTLEPESMHMRTPRIAITNLGSLYLVWMGGSGSDYDVFITASIDAGISFLPGTRVNNDTGTHEQRYPEVVVDDANSAHIVWSDGRNHQLGQSWDIYYARGHLEGVNGTRIASYEWDFDASIDSDGDGNYTNDVDATGPTPTHIYYDDGFYAVTLKVTDEEGLSGWDTCNITVLNVPPTPEWTSRSSDGTILNPPYPEGKEILFEATVYDPGIYDTFTYDWDFGDGTILLDAGSSVTHTYGDDDIYIVVLTVTDDDGGVGIDDTPPLDTANENPVASIDMPFCIFTEGTSPCEAIGQFTDPGWLDTHSAVWDYGDGTYENAVLTEENDPPDATGMNITSHIYGDNGVYNLSFTVVDDDGGVGTAWAEAQVQNLPPSLEMIAPSSVNEGEDFVLGITATDPGSDDLTIHVDWGDGTSETETHYNNGIGPDPPNSGEGVYSFTVCSNLTHIYGDNGNFTIQVTVEDDDGGSVQETVMTDVLNLPPRIDLPAAPLIFEEGEDFSLTATATDPGSDDLEFTWSFELGPSFTSLYYNDGTGPDPPLSPWGTFPFSAEDTVAHTYGDNGLYDVTITVSDDDGGSSASTLTIEVVNVEPSVDIGGPYAGDENSPVEFTATATDPGSDDLTLLWDWGDGTTDAMAFYNDGMSSDPPKSPWGTYPFVATHTISHIWGDNGDFEVTLTVTDDDGGISIQETEVTVDNIAPTIESMVYYLNASFAFRIAGEKWHNVEIHLYEDGTEVGYANITRYPGSPNEQMATLADISIDFSKTYSAVAYYTPEDDPINGQIWGATPAWVIIDYEDGEERIHHTFNVRHEDTWTWVIDDFSPHFLGHNITFMATASDPGSDDLTFSWNWGDGNITENTYYNDGIGPDPYPSPQVNPITVTDTARHAFASADTYTIILTVTDDDGSSATIVLTLTI